MSLPQMPAEPSKGDLVVVVQWLMSPGSSEQEQDVVAEYLGRHLPDPRWSDILFWPTRHPVTSAMSIDDATAEQVVEIAFMHRPIAL